MVPVKSRAQDCVLEVIKKHILPGSRLVNDSWKSYDCSESEGFQYLRVNHRYNLLDPDSGALKILNILGDRCIQKFFAMEGSRVTTVKCLIYIKVHSENSKDRRSTI